MHSIAFKLGPLTIHWYGIFVALGFLAGFWTAGRRAPRERITANLVYDLVPWLVVGGILGARSLYVFSYWQEEFAGKPFTEIFMIQKGGIVFYGGLIGAMLAALIFVRWKKLPLWKLADILAPSIALGYAFGRLGCLMNGCCYGRACDLPWAIHFPVAHATHGLPVHPTQIYDALLNTAFYAFLAWQFRHKKFDGQVFATYLIGYAFLRSFVEFFRGDYPVHYLGATPAQLVSIGIVAGGILLWYLLPRPVVKQG